VFNEKGNRLGVVDEDSGEFHDSGDDFSLESKGWHNIVITCDNNLDLKVVFYLDGRQTSSVITAVLSSPIKYIGNSKAGDEPFGIMSDLRVYPYILRSKVVAAQAKYHNE